MSIATDLKEVLQDVGTEIRVIKPDGRILKGEHIDLESSEAVNSFVRAFYLEGTLTADSAAVPGDIIEMVVTGHKNLVATKVPEIFENAVTSFNATLYRCNVTLDILRLAAGSSWDANYQLVNGWQPVKTDVPALLTDDAGTEIDADRDVGKLGIFNIARLNVPGHKWVRLKTSKSRKQLAQLNEAIENRYVQPGLFDTDRVVSTGTIFILGVMDGWNAGAKVPALTQVMIALPAPNLESWLYIKPLNEFLKLYDLPENNNQQDGAVPKLKVQPKKQTGNDQGN